METLEKSRVCRLCGKNSGISIDIFDKNDSHVKKINAILPILVHEMDLLPKQMCHRCSYKLEEFHKFYIECLKTDTTLKNQLSWMRKDTPKEIVGVPMVQIENVKIKSEPSEIDPLLETVGLVKFPISGVESDFSDCLLYTSFANSSRCQCYCDKSDSTGKAISKDCTHSDLHLEKRPDFTFRLSEAQEPEIIWKKQRRNLFGSSKELRSLNHKNALDLKSSSLKKTGSLSRNLRPRKRSVDYVGFKKKNPSSDLTEKSPQSTEPTLNLVTRISDQVLIKNEPLDTVESLRILRPRKQLETEIVREKSRSKSADRYRNRSKSKNRSISEAHEALELNIKREIVDNIENEGMELLDLRLKEEPEDSSLNNSKGLFNKRKDKIRVIKEMINNSGKFVDEIGVKINKARPNINKDNVDQDNIDNNSNRSNRSLINKLGHNVINKNNHTFNQNNFFKNGFKSNKELKRNKDRLDKGGRVIGKEALKTGKLSIKRNTKVHFSPKNLRSQDLHLRSGKVKVMNVLSPKTIRKDFRTGNSVLERFSDNIKMKTKFLNLEVKHFCDKCNYTFANKELFRLHACYSN